MREKENGKRREETHARQLAARKNSDFFFATVSIEDCIILIYGIQMRILCAKLCAMFHFMWSFMYESVKRHRQSDEINAHIGLARTHTHTELKSRRCSVLKLSFMAYKWLVQL